MPPKATTAPSYYQPILPSEITRANVAGHCTAATNFIAKYTKTPKKNRDTLGGDGEHIPSLTASESILGH